MTTTVIEKDFCEKILVRIHELSNIHKIDMVEATTLFCEEQDIDPTELVKQLKPNDVLQLRQAAISGNYVRKRVATLGAVLPI